MLVAAPLRLHDCSLVSDGAAAVVLTSTENAKASKKKAVEIAGIGHASTTCPFRSAPTNTSSRRARSRWRTCLSRGRHRREEVDIAEVHDCFTIAQLMTTEALGLSLEGKAGLDYVAGRFTATTIGCA